MEAAFDRNTGQTSWVQRPRTSEDLTWRRDALEGGSALHLPSIQKNTQGTLFDSAAEIAKKSAYSFVVP